MPQTPDDIIGMVFVSTDLVFPKPDQPRQYFDEGELKLLARSIEKEGQEHPSKVKILQEAGEKTTYQLIDGERRWRACAMLKRPLWALVCRVDSDAKHFRSSAVSNLASLALAPLEIARTLERVQRDYNMTQAEVAETFCKSTGWAGQHLSLLKLEPSIQAQLSGAIPKKSRLPTQVAIALVPFSHDVQVKFIARMRKGKWKTGRARQELRNLGRKLGVATKQGKRVRQPHDDYRVFLGFLKRIEEGIETTLEIPEDRFDAMFASRSQLERLSVLKKVQRNIDLLNVVQNAVRRATRPDNVSALKLG